MQMRAGTCTLYELPQDPNGRSQWEKSLTGSGFSKHLHMANGGCKQTEKDKSGCSYTGKAASTLDLTLHLSWLLGQSTIAFLMSNWGPFWAHVYMKSWLNKVLA